MSGSKATSPGCPMTAIPSGFVAAASLNCWIIFCGAQSEKIYCTLGPRSTSACRAPLYTLFANTPPGGPPGKKIILALHHFVTGVKRGGPAVNPAWVQAATVRSAARQTETDILASTLRGVSISEPPHVVM